MKRIFLMSAWALFLSPSFAAPIFINAEISAEKTRVYSLTDIHVVEKVFDPDRIFNSYLVFSIGGIMESERCAFSDHAVRKEVSPASTPEHLIQEISLYPINKTVKDMTAGGPLCPLPCLAKEFSSTFRIELYHWNKKPQRWSYTFKDSFYEQATIEVSFDLTTGWTFTHAIKNSRADCQF